MIRFECPHCKNPLALDAQYAGRDGWCRVCKQMVVVPMPGGPQCLTDLSADERYGRMKNLLKYAATKADEYKLLLARAQAATSSLLGAAPAQDSNEAEEQRVAQAEEAAALGEELRVVREKLSVSEEAIAQLRENADATQDDKITALREQLDTLREKLVERDEAITQMTEVAEAAQTLQENSDARIIEQVQEIAQLKESINAEETARQDAELDLDVVQQSSIRLIEQLAIPQKKLEDLSARAEEAEARESELASALTELDTAKIAALEDAKSDLSSAKEELRLAHDEVADLKDHAEQRKRVLAEALAEVERLGGALNSIEDELQGATVEQSDFSSSLEASKERLDEVNDELDEERQARSVAQRAQSQQLDDLDEAHVTINALQEKIVSLREELADAQSASQNLPAVIDNTFAVHDESASAEWATMAAHAEEEQVKHEQDQMMRTFLRFLEKK